MHPVDMDSLVDLMETDPWGFAYWLSAQMAYPETRRVLEWRSRHCCCMLKALVDLANHGDVVEDKTHWLRIVVGLLLPHAARFRCQYREHVNQLLKHAADSFGLMQLILPHCSDVDCPGDLGATAAWLTEMPLVLDLLVQHGADLNVYRGQHDEGLCGYYLKRNEGAASHSYYFKSLQRHVRSGVLHLYPCAMISDQTDGAPKPHARRLVRAHTHYCLDLLFALEKEHLLSHDLSSLVVEYCVPVV